MKIVVRKKDAFAVRFAQEWLQLSGQLSATANGVLTADSLLGGPLTVGIYSVQNDKMYKKADGTSTMRFSLYKNDSTKTEAADKGTSWKRQNKLLRSKLHPKQLASCDLGLALNMDLLDTEDSKDVVNGLVGETKIVIPREHRERGAAVIYRSLPYSQIVTQATRGLLGPQYVRYGTSALHNVAELLTTLKAAAFLGLPAVFDSYGEAVTVKRSLQVMQKSLAVLNRHTLNDLPEFAARLGLKEVLAQRANTVQIVPDKLLSAMGLPETVLNKTQPTSLDEFYRDGMHMLAKRILTAVNAEVPVTVTGITDALDLVFDVPLRQLAEQIHALLGHEVNLAQHPKLGTLSTNSYSLGSNTLRNLHVEGYKASGAVLYYAFYAIAQQTSFVAIAMDGSKGNVHLLAKGQMEKGNLYLCPAGSIGIYPENPDKLTFLDPWVFLTLIENWGNSKAEQYLKMAWDAIETPLPVSRIGKTKKVLVGLDGLKIVEE